MRKLIGGKYLNWIAFLIFGLLIAPSLPRAQGVLWDVPFAKRKVSIAGIEGRVVTLQSGDPKSFDALIGATDFPKREVDGQLFLSSGAERKPVIIYVPPLSGIGDPNLRHAEKLIEAGFGVFMLDPFGARGLNTIAGQTALGLSPIVYDVLQAAKHLASLPEIDPKRIGAVGNSLAGSVLVHVPVSSPRDAVLGKEGPPLKAVLAAWPFCGLQFENPETAPTILRFLLAGADNLFSVSQCQAYAQAMRSRNTSISVRIVKDAAHGFGSGEPAREFADSPSYLNVPIIYLNKKGEYLDPYTGEFLPPSKFSVGDTFRPFLKRGVTIGSRPGDADIYIGEIVSFFREAMSQ